MSIAELGELSEREILLLVLERMDGVLEKIHQHDNDIASLQTTRTENSSFFKGVNWVLGIPGVIALLLSGKQHL